MIKIDTSQVRTRFNRIARELKFTSFFRALDIEPEQEQYFMKRGIDNNRPLAPVTIKRRQRKLGYYKIVFERSGVSPRRPRMVWGGNTLWHTHKKRGKLSISPGRMSISHNLKRQVKNYWDEKPMAKYVESAMGVYFKNVVRGNQNLKRVRGKTS